MLKRAVIFSFALVALFAIAGCNGDKKPKRGKNEVVVISYNVDADESTLINRGPLMTDLINTLYPDSVGFQEARPGWLHLLTKNLKAYSYVGVSADGSNPHPGSFGNYIFYLKDKYEVVLSGNYWHSDTPLIPSIYPGADCNRYCVWAIFKNKKTGTMYAHINTHLNWLPNKKATEAGARMVRSMADALSEMGIPVFVTGDFNDGENSNTYKIMTEGIFGDSKFLTEDTMNVGTYPHYGDYDPYKENPNVIDYIFVTEEKVEVLQYRVLDERPGGEYISDHFGIYVMARIPEDKVQNRFTLKEKPSFQEDSYIKISRITKSDAVITFSKAVDDFYVDYYEVKVMNEEGKVVYKNQVSSGLYHGDILDELEIKITKGRLDPGKKYYVEVYATNLFGNTCDKPLKTEFASAEDA
jgi:endonuclease/exonuclease/phosphatase family metal-dependent hydrolase